MKWRGVVAQSVQSRTLIHEVVGSNLAAVTSFSAPQRRGSDLHLGQFHRADYTTMLWNMSHEDKSINVDIRHAHQIIIYAYMKVKVTLKTSSIYFYALHKWYLGN